MAEFILSYKAVDFDNTVFDMPSLSAIRGASLGYLYSPRRVEAAISKRVPVNPVYAGASRGAWRLSCDRETAKAVVEDVRRALRGNDLGGENPTGPHAVLSYTVAAAEIIGGDERRALELSESLNAAEALQGRGFPLPVFNIGLDCYDEGGDRMRPSVKGKPSAERGARERFGREQRQGFYETHGGVTPDHDFTNDFETMASAPPKDIGLSPGSKTAVFYADGNGLGKLRQVAIDELGLDGLKAYSSELLGLQKAMLGKLVGWLNEGAVSRPDHFLAGGAFRFETLMWGGDEVLFVMPSWLALEFARNFFDWTRDWVVHGKPVTMAAGMVIANHKTPIRQTKNLAAELAELNKDENRGRSAIQMEVFESISVPDTDLKTYRDRLYFPRGKATEPAVYAPLSMEPGRLEALTARIRALKADDGLPKSQLYSILRQVSEQAEPQSTAGLASPKDMFDKWKERAGSETHVRWEDLMVLDGAAGGGAAEGFSLAALAMLWDYVTEPSNSGRE